MAQLFYDHLVDIGKIRIELDKYSLTIVEREEILNIISEHIHHRLLDIVLKKLPKNKHQQFLHQLHHQPHDKRLLKALKTEIDDLERSLKKEIEKIKKDILLEIKRSQKPHA